MKSTLRLSPKDNVVTCLRAVVKGTVVGTGGEAVVAAADIPQFHKMALVPIVKGAYCYKYSEIIGRATADIRAGDHVHVHNIESTRGRGDKQGMEP